MPPLVDYPQLTGVWGTPVYSLLGSTFCLLALEIASERTSVIYQQCSSKWEKGSLPNPLKSFTKHWQMCFFFLVKNGKCVVHLFLLTCLMNFWPYFFHECPSSGMSWWAAPVLSTLFSSLCSSLDPISPSLKHRNTYIYTGNFHAFCTWIIHLFSDMSLHFTAIIYV